MEHSYFLRNSAAWAALILLLGAASVSAQYGSASNPIPADWIEYQDKTEGFAVSFPTRPEEKLDKFSLSKGGPALTRHFYASYGRDVSKGRYMVGSVTLPIAPPANGTAVITRKVFEQLMAKLKDSFELSMQAGGETGCYLGSPQDAFSGPHRGREYKLEGSGCPTASVRMFPTARRFYVVATVGGSDPAFLRSFQILESGERLIVE